MHAMRVRMLAVGLVAVVAGVIGGLNAVATGQNRGNSAFDDAVQKYERDLNRPSLYIRTRSARRFAATHDSRVLDYFMRRYRRPEQPQDHVRYLLAGIAAREFTGAETLETFNQWAGQNTQDGDCWLWFHTQSLNVAAGNDAARVVNDAKSNRNDYLAAVSLEALARAKQPAVLDLVAELMADVPRRGMARSLRIEGCAAALAHMKASVRDPKFRAAAMPVIRELGERATDDRTKLVIARQLKIAFDADQASLSPQYWMQILDGAAMQNDPQYAAPRPTFIGVEASGKRIAYVIDMSDSMLIPLTGKEKEELKSAITRGPNDPEAPNGGGNNNAGNNVPNLPWDSIKNRFDAAREFLKLSLRQLEGQDDMAFTVIAFGTEAKPLDSTPGMIPVGRNSIRRVIAELDAITPGPPAANRPHGTLRGFTNLHGGILRAFQMTSRRVLETNEHVDSRGFAEGVDTIFVLSDGEPSWDDFDAVDQRDPEDQAGDPEAGTTAGNTPSLHYYGPYVEREWVHLLDDVLRMNMLRRAEIHCIGIGEANIYLLEQITQIGQGKLRRIAGN